jgi:transposase
MSLKKRQANTPLRVRPLRKKHIKKLRQLQRSSQAVVYRRATILLLSLAGRSVQEIALLLGVHVQTVREWIRTFNAADRKKRWKLFLPRRPTGRHRTFTDAVAEGLVELLRQSPRHYGIQSEVWTLHDLARVAQETGLVKSISLESVRRLLHRKGIVYLQAKWWITSPDPHYEHKKARRDGWVARAHQDPTIAVVYQDEAWFSGNPRLTAGWGDGDSINVEKPEQKLPGAWVLYAAEDAVTGWVHRHYAPRCNQGYVKEQLMMLLRFYQALGKRLLVVVWDNASWHTGKMLRRWVCEYNRQAKQSGRIRLLLVYLPRRSPWLNPLEAIFSQAKRRVIGRNQVADNEELRVRVEQYFVPRSPPLVVTA